MLPTGYWVFAKTQLRKWGCHHPSPLRIAATVQNTLQSKNTDISLTSLNNSKVNVSLIFLAYLLPSSSLEYFGTTDLINDWYFHGSTAVMGEKPRTLVWISENVSIIGEFGKLCLYALTELSFSSFIVRRLSGFHFVAIYPYNERRIDWPQVRHQNSYMEMDFIVLAPQNDTKH